MKVRNSLNCIYSTKWQMQWQTCKYRIWKKAQWLYKSISREKYKCYIEVRTKFCNILASLFLQLKFAKVEGDRHIYWHTNWHVQSNMLCLLKKRGKGVLQNHIQYYICIISRFRYYHKSCASQRYHLSKNMKKISW